MKNHAKQINVTRNPGDFTLDSAIENLNASGDELRKQGAFVGFYYKMMARWLSELKTLRVEVKKLKQERNIRKVE
jgi:hypothetical protein